MRVRSRCFLALVVVIGVVAVPRSAFAQSETDAVDDAGGRLIVGFTPKAMVNGDANEATEDVGGDRVRRIRSVSLDIVEVEDVDAAIEEYLEQPGVRYVEIDHAASALSNDPLWVNQWNMQPVSSSNKGTANVEGAWARSRGNDVVVAVVDTGVRTGGSDLDSSRVLAGKDFVNLDDDATDDNGHGTHVAGTIAQSTDNDRGVAGVAPGAKILPVKVLDATGAGFYSDIIAGISWAKDHGAKVINLSLGAYEFSQAMCDAVTSAANAGVVVVASSGNDGVDSISYPAKCDAALAVGAVRYDGQVVGYSNRGPQLDLVAPGGDMSVDQNGDGYPDGILQQNYTTSWAYRFYEGTSMAAPHVAGVAALVIGANPSANVEGILTSTARDLGAAGRDDASGYGAIDADVAVQRAGGAGAGSGDGYWLASTSGGVRSYGSAKSLGSAASRGSTAKLAAIEETPSGNGYWLLDEDGGVHAFGDAPYFGSVSELRVAGKAPAGVRSLDLSATPSGKGYWIMDAAGGIFTFGDAQYYGGVPGLRQAGVPIGPATVIDMASTPSGRGYFVLDDVGGMFTFGDAEFIGSVPALRNAGHQIGPAKIVGLAATSKGDGYWMVDDVGGMFAFGDASFLGSIPGLRNSGVNIGKATIVAMEPTRDASGYWLVDDAGGIFTFGSAKYQGSFPASGVSATAVGIAPSGR